MRDRAPVCTSWKCDFWSGLAGFQRKATRDKFGTVSFRISSRFVARPAPSWVDPVTLPPGCARLATSLVVRGSRSRSPSRNGSQARSVRRPIREVVVDGCAPAACGVTSKTARASARMSERLTFTARLPGDRWDTGKVGRQARDVKAPQTICQLAMGVKLKPYRSPSCSSTTSACHLICLGVAEIVGGVSRGDSLATK